MEKKQKAKEDASKTPTILKNQIALVMSAAGSSPEAVNKAWAFIMQEARGPIPRVHPGNDFNLLCETMLYRRRWVTFPDKFKSPPPPPSFPALESSVRVILWDSPFDKSREKYYMNDWKGHHMLKSFVKIFDNMGSRQHGFIKEVASHFIDQVASEKSSEVSFRVALLCNLFMLLAEKHAIEIVDAGGIAFLLRVLENPTLPKEISIAEHRARIAQLDAVQLLMVTEESQLEADRAVNEAEVVAAGGEASDAAYFLKCQSGVTAQLDAYRAGHEAAVAAAAAVGGGPNGAEAAQRAADKAAALADAVPKALPGIADRGIAANMMQDLERALAAGALGSLAIYNTEIFRAIKSSGAILALQNLLTLTKDKSVLNYITWLLDALMAEAVTSEEVGGGGGRDT